MGLFRTRIGHYLWLPYWVMTSGSRYDFSNVRERVGFVLAFLLVGTCAVNADPPGPPASSLDTWRDAPVESTYDIVSCRVFEIRDSTNKWKATIPQDRVPEFESAARKEGTSYAECEVHVFSNYVCKVEPELLDLFHERVREKGFVSMKCAIIQTCGTELAIPAAEPYHDSVIGQLRDLFNKIERKPKAAQTHYDLAMLLKKHHAATLAVRQELLKVLAADPTHADALFAVAETYVQEPDNGLKWLETQRKTNSKWADAASLLCFSLAVNTQKNVADIVDIATPLLSMRSLSQKNRRNLVLFLAIYDDNDEKAIEYGKQIVTFVSDRTNQMMVVDALHRAGEVALAKEMCSVAEPFYQRLLAIDPSDPRALVRMAFIENILYQHVVAPLDKLYRAGKIYLARGDREWAISCVDLMRKVAPNPPLAARLLELIYSADNDNSAKRDARSQGTGWFCAEGIVVTCHHVIDGASDIVVVGESLGRSTARIVAQDRANDIAVLRVKGSSLPSPLMLGKRTPKMGENVFTVGFPHADLLGMKPKFTEGTVSATTGIKDDPRTLQIAVPVQAGNSGGPLLNSKGEVVGIVSHKLSAAKVFAWTGDLPENVNYAVKTAYLRPLLESVNDALPKSNPLGEKQTNAADLAARIKGSIVMVVAE